MSHDEHNEHSPLRFLPAERHAVTLDPRDVAAVDALLGEGTPVDTTASQDARQQRAADWLNVLGHAPAAPAPDDLLQRTLRAIEKDTQRAPAHEALETVRLRSLSWGRHVGQVLAMACAACVALGVVLPGLGMARQSAKRTTCAANLGGTGMAMAAYAQNYAGALPALAAGNDGDWREHCDPASRAQGHSNSANLLPLVRSNYVSAQHLVCPAHVVDAGNAPGIDLTVNEIPDIVRGYSYINLFGPHPTWDHDPNMIVLADRNPLFSAEAQHDPYSNSPNHGRTGMNVLATNGAVIYVHSPNVGPGEDNIWTIGATPQSVYTGRETVRNVRDLFLAP